MTCCHKKRFHLHCADRKITLIHFTSATKYPLCFANLITFLSNTGGLTNKRSNANEKQNQEKAVTKLRI